MEDHYLVRDGTYWGPYSLEQLSGFVANGVARADELVWDPNGETWTAIGALLSRKAPPPVLRVFCERHPEKDSVGICWACDRAICPACMKMSGDGFFCIDCFRAGARIAKVEKEFVGSFGRVMSANPLIGCVIIIALVTALNIALGERAWERGEDLGNRRATGYFAQALRTSFRAFEETSPPDRSERDLSRARNALDKIIHDPEVGEVHRRISLGMRMQIDLMTDTHGELDALARKYVDGPAKPFFEACQLHFVEKDHEEAITILAPLLARHENLTITETRNYPEEYRLFEISQDELLFVLGDAHFATGNIGEARRMWSGMSSGTIWVRHAERRLGGTT